MDRKVWFTADLHFSHKNILKFQDNRREELGLSLDDPDILKKHNEMLIERWNYTIGKKDTVYIIGDFSFADGEETRKILERLHGRKFMILGNHDKSLNGLDNYFESVSQIKEVSFKKKEFSYLDEDIFMVLCHFPIVAWNRRLYGSLMVHGHTHGSIDDMNKKSGELRVDVGFDGELADFGFVELEQLYNYFLDIKGDYLTFKNYIEAKSDIDGIRY